MNEKLEIVLKQIEELKFSGNQKCIEVLDNRLQSIIEFVSHLPPSGEFLELKLCSWTLHERYHMDDPDQLQWTFNHTHFRILKNVNEILRRNYRNEMLNHSDSKAA